jgi:hypothetical protein
MSHSKKAKKYRDESAEDREKRRDEKKTAKVCCEWYCMSVDFKHVSLSRLPNSWDIQMTPIHLWIPISYNLLCGERKW